jgi:hypothetical protein
MDVEAIAARIEAALVWLIALQQAEAAAGSATPEEAGDG